VEDPLKRWPNRLYQYMNIWDSGLMLLGYCFIVLNFVAIRINIDIWKVLLCVLMIGPGCFDTLTLFFVVAFKIEFDLTSEEVFAEDDIEYSYKCTDVNCINYPVTSNKA
jgi:hypothetical protein